MACIPQMRTQIVAARTVAEVAAGIAASAGDPAQIAEIAGPHEEDLAALATLLAARRGTPVKVQAGRNPADPDAGMQATGGLLPGPGARLAGPTFQDWLGQQYRERVAALRVRPIAAGRARRARHEPARHYLTRLARSAGALTPKTAKAG